MLKSLLQGVTGGLALPMAVKLAALVGAVLLAALVAQTVRLSAARGDLVEARGALAVCQSANESNVKTIDELRTANATWAAEYAARTEQAAQAAERIERLQLQLQTEAARGAQQRREIYEGDGYARAWAAAVVPDGIARRLRQPTGSSN